MGKVKLCPRCEEYSYEILATHSHCWSCLYSPVLDSVYEPCVPKWVHKFEPKASNVSFEAFLEEKKKLPLEGPVLSPTDPPIDIGPQ